jgi:hypothetical protein
MIHRCVREEAEEVITGFIPSGSAAQFANAQQYEGRTVAVTGKTSPFIPEVHRTGEKRGSAQTTAQKPCDTLMSRLVTAKYWKAPRSRRGITVRCNCLLYGSLLSSIKQVLSHTP